MLKITKKVDTLFNKESSRHDEMRMSIWNRSGEFVGKLSLLYAISENLESTEPPEISVRREYSMKDDDVGKVDVKRAEDRYRVFLRVLSPGDRQESFSVLTLDPKLHPLTESNVVFRGTMDATTVHQREVFQEAIRWGAYAIMVAHNHPSGDPTPSAQDVELTRKLVEVSRIMAIPLLDHIIVGAVDSVNGKGFVSMRENGSVEFK